MKILIVAGMPIDEITGSYDVVIGVDAGNLHLLHFGIRPDLAVGDFDSVSADDFLKIKNQSRKLLKLPEKKDDTDLEIALNQAFEISDDAKVTIIGALGGRMDHMLSNLYLPTTSTYRAHARQIQLVNAQNVIRYYPCGTYILKRLEGMKYIGFVQVDTGESLEITGAKYPLKAADNFKTIYTSNEFLTDTMTISHKKGMLIVIYTKDEIPKK
ncbi:thiamine diphosphokinase [Lactococcus hircilactis]|uniref:Thiamine diphosphokinase n=1 Tax=Lactococcus hircilactis TaxID=1494462 RepID=A0A7X1ZB48_9LACT|nr:thiamine diphosphokinase [Lactococcus hircilactis]MQW40126.1 thiamine diphosphokinase [Lactococcus hircilactis]